MNQTRSESTIRFLSWGIVIFFMTYLCYLFMEVEGRIPNALFYLDFYAPKPFVFRILVPVLGNIIRAFGVPPLLSLLVITFASGLAAYWQMEILFDYYNIRIYAGLCFVLLFALMINSITVMDWTTVFLFLLSYNLLRRYNIKAMTKFLLLFPIITMHRETSILLILLFGFAYWKRVKPASHYWLILSYLFITWITVRAVIMNHFRNNDGVILHYFWDVMGVYLRTPAMLAALLILVVIFFIVRKYWYTYDDFIQSAFALFPIQLLLHIILGKAFETRVLAESFPVVYMVVLLGLLPARIRYRSRYLKNHRP